MLSFIFIVILQLILFSLPSPSFLSALPKIALAYLLIFLLPVSELLAPYDEMPGKLFIILMLASIAASTALGLAATFAWRDPLERWAADEGLVLIRIDRRAYFRGPFFWRTSTAQQVYRIAIQNGPERYRWGWICLGSYLLGMFSSKAEVRWDAGAE